MPKDIIDGFSRDIQCATSRYFTEEATPQNTSVTSSAIKSGPGGQFLQNKIVIKAATDVTLADTTTLTATYEDSADGSTGWVGIGSKTITASGATTIDAGDDIVVDFGIPDQARAYTRVTIATTDASAGGTFDCYNSREPKDTF